MKTLIVPCAGKSSRFPNMKPKWMLTHPEGMLMLDKNLSAIDTSVFDRIIITIVKEHDVAFDAAFILKQAFSHPKFEILILDDFTNGPAETVYKTIKKSKVEGPIVVRDSDSFTKVDLKNVGENFLVGINLKSIPEIDRVADKSFIILNEQGNVANIIEKKVVSDIIGLGIYGFKSHQDFVSIFEKLQSSMGESQEIYVSHVTAYQIGINQELVLYSEATLYDDWGTLETWKKTMKRYTSYLFDLDGVLLKNTGKYGKENWDNTFLPIEENILALKSLSDSGAQIIITTSRPESYRKKLEDFFRSREITIHSIIMGMNHAPRVIINDFAPTNPYPSCDAINVPRNAPLKDYLK